MSSEQPENDPFRKQEPPQAPPPPQDAPAGGPYGSDPYRSGAQQGGPYGAAPYPPGSAGDVHGSPYGAPDPLAGMPPLASRGRRLVARILDAIIVGVPVGIVMALLTGGAGDTTATFAQSLVYQIVYLVYEGLMLQKRGQTLGKRLLGVRVAMLQNGSAPQGSPAWFRAATYSLPPLVPCLGQLFWLVNVLFCTWDRPYRQCLHDKAAKTVVVSA